MGEFKLKSSHWIVDHDDRIVMGEGRMVILDRIEETLQLKGFAVKRYAKPTFARSAPLELQQTIRSESDAVIEALAD